jgi:hypothetical protein
LPKRQAGTPRCVSNLAELGSLLADKTAGLTDPDDAPAAPRASGVADGDLWIMGRHRLLCGDSTVATDVERVLGGVEPHLERPP